MAAALSIPSDPPAPSAPTTFANAALEARDLACRRGERLLFARLSLRLKHGDALHLAGPNGVGKSSLIRILARLSRPFAGTVERSGDIALLDERLALDTHLPLGRALGFWAQCDGLADEAAARIAGRVGIDGLLDVPVRYLSTGQRRRAALARMAGRGASIWMLDEPLNGLDAASTDMVEGLIAEHCGAGGIALVASHQPIRLPGMARLSIPDYAA